MRPIIVMGVSGCGKSTLGKRVAERLGRSFMDADDYHPAANVAKMQSGRPLDDDDRAAWLVALNTLLRNRDGVVLACSALRQAYRDALAAGLPEPPVFIFLKGSEAILRARMEGREGHFMPPALLSSQLATLEEPADAIVVPVEIPMEEQVEAALRGLARI